ncbi:MAG: hypothetical protein LW809_06830 [Vampirovibrionales bacterium]|jgi:tRNA U34 5-methylaminomethyl-2-thiouridine-forming methyltransferase MnmC|nr:hypothetical protein [Vampirovibrionales bacterium]
MTPASDATHLRKTLKDGSFSLVDVELNETYHNWAGAFTEAIGHYAQPALARLETSTSPLEHLRLWDVCFGLGYNSFAFIQAVLASPLLGAFKSLEIQAVEIDGSLAPLWQEVLAQAHFTNLTQAFHIEQVKTTFGYVLSFQAKEATSPLPQITMHIHIADALAILPQWVTEAKPSVDIIFHDAFSPSKVPHLWSSDVFTLYASVLDSNHGGILTYSLARSVKTAVEASGLTWRKLPPLGWKKGAMLIFHR